MTGPKDFEEDDHSWRDRALCKGMDINLFFSEGRGYSSKTKEAEETCSACPVRKDCLNYALKYNIRDGVWGGEVHRARRAARKESPFHGKRKAS